MKCHESGEDKKKNFSFFKLRERNLGQVRLYIPNFILGRRKKMIHLITKNVLDIISKEIYPFSFL